jgi:AraC-like DNA-binding protein
MQMYAPNPRLASRVVILVVAENTATEVPVLPVPGAVMGVQYRGHVVAEQGPLSQAGVTGIQSHLRRFIHPEATGSVLVRFTAQGAACLGVPASHLLNESVSLEDLLGRVRSAELCERLCEAPNDRARVLVVEQFLMNLPFANDSLVAHATGFLTQEAPLSVAQVAARLGVSERQLERRFRGRVGVSPKQFARLARFERAVAVAKALPPGATRTVGDDPATVPSLSAIAQRAGYYDQSHLAREVRQFAGVTPGQLFLPPR